MKKITILGDPTIDAWTDQPHPGKMQDEDQRIAYRRIKAHPAKGFKPAV